MHSGFCFLRERPDMGFYQWVIRFDPLSSPLARMEDLLRRLQIAAVRSLLPAIGFSRGSLRAVLRL